MKKVLRFLTIMLIVAGAIGLVGCEQAVDPGNSTDTSGAVDGTTVYGTVGGRIIGPDGMPLAGIPVSSTTGGVSRAITTVTTDSNGHFEIPKLISGVHTIFMGNGITSTTKTVTVNVPDLAALKTAAALPTTTAATGEIVSDPAMIKAGNGPYYVNLSLLGSGADLVTLYPCTATISGVAKIKTASTDSDEVSAFPTAGYYVVADFAAFNGSSSLTFRAPVTASTGAFTLANVPAVGLITSGNITLRLDYDAIIADGTTGTSDTTTAVSPTGIGDGLLQAGGTRQVGTHYFVAAIAPKIVGYSPDISGYAKFDPGTQLAPTALEFTFSKAMDTAKGTLTLTDGDTTVTQNNSYLFTGAWTVGNTVYTVTPAAMFEYGKTITATFTGFESADNVPMATPFTATFLVRDALSLLSSSTWTAYGTTPLNSVQFPVSGDVVLTFNAPLSEFNAFDTYLQDSNSQFIPAAITISGSTLTINPTASLVNNMTYKVLYKVKGGLFANDDILTDSTGTACGFTTAPATQLATPTLALDVPTKYIADSAKSYWQKGKYNFGEQALKVQVGYVAGADNYIWEYQFAGDPGWTAGGNLDTSAMTLSSDLAYYIASLSLPGTVAVDPTKALTIRARARDIAAPLTGAPDSAWVTSGFSFADTQSPSALAATSDFLDGGAVASYTNNGPGTSDGFTVTINANANNDQYYSVTFGLAGTEPMATILPSQVVAQGTPTALSVAQVSMTKDATGANTSCTVLFSKASLGASNPSGIYAISVKDAANNAYDNLNPAPVAGTDTVILITIN